MRRSDMRLPIGRDGLRLALALVAGWMASLGVGCAQAPETFPVPPGAEKLVWETQSWETGGGSCALVLWADGRSEMRVTPTTFDQRRGELRPLPGWSAESGPRGPSFVRRGLWPPDESRDRFHRAWAAGIAEIEPFQPEYVDGEGTRIELQVDGESEEKVIPLFLGDRLDTPDHHRFQAVAKILGPCEGHGYEVVEGDSEPSSDPSSEPVADPASNLPSSM